MHQGFSSHLFLHIAAAPMTELCVGNVVKHWISPPSALTWHFQESKKFESDCNPSENVTRGG